MMVPSRRGDRQRRIERDRLLEQADRDFEIGLALHVIMRKALEEAIPGGDVVGQRPRRRRGFGAIDLGGDRG